jgi:Cu-processing system ATP-binding protein
MITITGLTKRFGKLDVLRSLDLEMGAGRVTAIVGPNGAGKTTLIKAMLGLTRADAGSITIDGNRVSEDPAYRAAIGYMPQSARFPENLTGAEVLSMLRDLRHPTTAVDEGLITQFGLEGDLAKPLRTLSGGTRQKVNAAMAFLFDPAVLILDEPTAGLDPVASGILKNKVREARTAGKTLVLTSHIMSELEELADDVAFLLDGQVRFAGPVHDLKVKTRQLSLERAIAEMMTRPEAA